MFTILVDCNIEGQAVILWHALMANGWLELFPMRMIMFADVGLAANSSDRTIWRFAQAHNMLLLTNNRSSHEANSLELTILEENTPTALPVLTIGNVERMRERNYREKCAERIIEIFMEFDNYLGTGRVFIP